MFPKIRKQFSLFFVFVIFRFSHFFVPYFVFRIHLNLKSKITQSKIFPGIRKSSFTAENAVMAESFS
jgi:hypothetical protein